jgi:hypothetical protein
MAAFDPSVVRWRRPTQAVNPLKQFLRFRQQLAAIPEIAGFDV